jgi:hypothetical protein
MFDPSATTSQLLPGNATKSAFRGCLPLLLNVHKSIEDDFRRQHIRRRAGRYAWRGEYPMPLPPLFDSRQQGRARMRAARKKLRRV